MDKINKIKNFITNSFLSRSALFSRMIDEQRDINQECGYPNEISSSDYKLLYDREGIAARVVSVFPEESWSVDPMVIENEDSEDTEFETAWKDLEKKLNLYHFMERVDELSGIGPFGIMLLGINDGKATTEAVDSVKDDGTKQGNPSHQLLFVRTFPDSAVSIDQFETKTSNPRFGKPVKYTINMNSSGNTEGSGDNNLSPEDTNSLSVHWTRIIHVADNRKASEIYGQPRMQDVFNRLYDLRKVLSGSGEMFWKGAFPGYSFEINPDVADGTAEIDTKSVREELERYSNGLQRYLALTGLSAKSLAPQVASPEPHMIAHLKAIAISKGVPWRIFLGSEEAKLASDQDKKSWNSRVMRRQNKYLSPMLVREIVNRLQAYGTLPEAEYVVEWPDLNTVTDKDKAEVALKRTEALAKYVAASVDSLIPPMEYFTKIMGMDADEAQAIIDAAGDMLNDLEDDDTDGISTEGDEDGNNE